MKAPHEHLAGFILGLLSGRTEVKVIARIPETFRIEFDGFIARDLVGNECLVMVKQIAPGTGMPFGGGTNAADSVPKYNELPDTPEELLENGGI